MLLGAQYWCSAQHVHTDRTLYFAGDTVRGVVYSFLEESLDNSYILSLNQGSNAIGSELIFLTKKAQSFSLPIPDYAKSGDLSLHVYDYQNGLLTHQAQMVFSDLSKESVSFERERFESPRQLALTPLYSQLENQIGTVAFEGLGFSRDQIESISISITDALQDLPAASTNRRDALGCRLAENHYEVVSNSKSWKKGYQISGTVLSEDSEPVDRATIYLSIAQNQALDLDYTRTDQFGRFFFNNIIYPMKTDAFISPVGLSANTKIRLDENEFSINSDRTRCDSEFISIDIKEQNRMSSIHRRVQNFYKEEKKDPVWEILEPKPLFEDRDELSDQDEYVSFKTVTEMVKESVPNVSFRKGNLSVFSSELRTSLKKQPLIFIDGVIVSQAVFLTFEASNVKFIEVIHSPLKLKKYGSEAFGGIISMVSKRGFSKRDHALTVPVPTYTGYVEFQAPRPTESTPYFPPVLYWNPSLNLEDLENFSVSFQTPEYDSELRYKVMVQLENNELYQAEGIIQMNLTK